MDELAYGSLGQNRYYEAPLSTEAPDSVRVLASATARVAGLNPLTRQDDKPHMPALALLPIALVVCLGSAFHYIWVVARLLRRVEADHPEIWRELGEPQWVHVTVGVDHSWFVQPAGPIVLWLIRGGETRLDEGPSRLYGRARASMVGFAIGMSCFAAAMLRVQGML